MSINVGVIGIGNCGSQIAMLAKKLGAFPAIAMNSSERDIEAINGSIDAIVFGSRAGAGKNRALALDYLKRNMDKVIGEPSLDKLVTENDLIVIVTSTGGGTGSGTAPLLADALDHQYNSKIERDDEKKMFINIGVLPSVGESVGAQRNTIEYLSQLIEKRPDRRYMLFDNNRVKASMMQVNNTINRDVVECLKIIRGDYSIKSQYSMIDEEDTRKLITTPGMIFIDYIKDIYEETIPVGGTVEDLLIEHVNRENHCVRPDRNKVVKYLGFVSNLDETIHPYFDENLPKIRKIFGEPTEDFRHFAINEDGPESNMLAVILTGMTAPENRLNEITKRIKEADEGINVKEGNSKLSELTSTVSKYDGNKVGRNAKQDFDLDALMSKY